MPRRMTAIYISAGCLRYPPRTVTRGRRACCQSEARCGRSLSAALLRVWTARLAVIEPHLSIARRSEYLAIIGEFVGAKGDLLGLIGE